MRFLLVAVVIAAAATLFVGSTLPPRQATLSNSFSDTTVPGIVHVHSVRSDGRGTPDEIADAASRAGLKFVVMTDHGDGTRTPEPAVYRHGVLCLDGVEISTSGGHYIALDMPASPYVIGGEARDVVDDIKRLGGFGVAAHPDSPKPELSWRGWNTPFDAIEIVNLDTAWRERIAAASWRPRVGLAARLLSYPIRPAESIADLIQPSAVWSRWETEARHRRLTTIAGADAHGGMPSYLASFRTLSVHVRPERPFTGNAAVDASILMRGIRAGHTYSVIDGIASPASFEFTASNAHGTVHGGDQLAAGGTVTLRVRSNAPPEFTTTVWNGTAIVAGDRHEQEFSVDAPEGAGVYRAEIRAPGQSKAPWITSNPVYVRTLDPLPRAAVNRPAISSQALFDAQSLKGWQVEQDPTSLSAVDPVVTGIARQPALRFRFGLAGGPAAGQFAALVVDIPQGLGANDRVTFTARAEQPMRLSVQLRTESERWQRSVFVDTFNLERTVYFDDMIPAGATRTEKPLLGAIRGVMFVVDTTHTKPGTSGRVWISGPVLQH